MRTGLNLQPVPQEAACRAHIQTAVSSEEDMWFSCGKESANWVLDIAVPSAPSIPCLLCRDLASLSLLLRFTLQIPLAHCSKSCHHCGSLLWQKEPGAIVPSHKVQIHVTVHHCQVMKGNGCLEYYSSLCLKLFFLRSK